MCTLTEPCAREETADAGNDARKDHSGKLNIFFCHLLSVLSILFFYIKEDNEVGEDSSVDTPRQANDGRIQRRREQLTSASVEEAPTSTIRVSRNELPILRDIA